MKAVVVDKDYGSVTSEELETVKKAYAKAGIDLELQHFTTEDEIIAGCQDAMAILGTGNPPVTRRVIESLPDLKFVQRFGIGSEFYLTGCSSRTWSNCIEPSWDSVQRNWQDLACAMIMGLIRNTNYYDKEIRKGNWPKCQYLLPARCTGTDTWIIWIWGCRKISARYFPWRIWNKSDLL